MPSTYNSAAERNKNAQVCHLSLTDETSRVLADGPCVQLTSGYDEIARSLFSDGLSHVGNYELGEVIGKGIPRPPSPG